MTVAAQLYGSRRFTFFPPSSEEVRLILGTDSTALLSGSLIEKWPLVLIFFIPADCLQGWVVPLGPRSWEEEVEI